ncbi:MAG: hypothetical protein MH204_05095, partial [Fimbriimonadaceae bacterium]|nr:hypothetical protein [Fimbriimonadaceae bacterium]
LNGFLGEQWLVNGSIQPADATSGLLLTRFGLDPVSDRWTSDVAGVDPDGNPFSNPSTLATPISVGGDILDSGNPRFATVFGSIRDGREGTDFAGFVRGVSRVEPPSILTIDPQTQRSRYAMLTRESGEGGAGRVGAGEGVYVDSPERGNIADEDDRRTQAAVRNLPSDWLNPSNPNSVGWTGPYYIPVAPMIRFTPNGFEITRDSRSRRPTFRSATNPGDGRRSTALYRVRNIAGTWFILDSLTNPGLASLADAAITDAQFAQSGREFNGVVMFEGDVRVRGMIPADLQVTLVSLGSVYIDGSIIKGTIRPDGTVLSRPSTSMLMLMAKDHVVVNTTMFFGPEVGSPIRVKTAALAPDTPAPLEISPTDPTPVDLAAVFLKDPNGGAADPFNPQTWRSHARAYSNASGPVFPELVIQAAADDNGPSFASIEAQPFITGVTGFGPAPLPIPRGIDFGAAGIFFGNAAGPWYDTVAYPTEVPVYGLGLPAINAYPKFETVGLSLFGSGSTENAQTIGFSSPGFGGRVFSLDETTVFRLRSNLVGTSPSKNFLLSRAAVLPHDIRIEASMYAEEGSFFVIPGDWFNSNPADTRAAFNAAAASVGRDQALADRYQNFGSGPRAPFYGEPLPVRVQIIGSVSENMPAAMSQQMEWLRKWGWMPAQMGGATDLPSQFFTFSAPTAAYVPNLTITYDPALATGSADGVNPIRTD